VRRRAAALALVTVTVLTACGEKEERAPGPSHVEVRALVAAATGAMGSDTAPSVIAFSAEGRVLSIRLSAPPAGGAVLGLLASFRGVHAEVAQFCPKPALLRCRPALQASASARSPDAAGRTAAALRDLAAITYEGRPLVRRDAGATLIVTAHDELLAGARKAGPAVTFAFGGLDPPRRPAPIPAGRLVVEAGTAALVAARRELPPAAQRALAGVRRVVLSAPLR
jgi:hypothetical protein